MSTSVTYLRYELLRTVRNTRFFIFSLVFPLILFYVVAGANKTLTLGNIPFPTYYMAGMISWGTMAAVLAGGARIAAERSVGWNRQLRLTPLTPRTYFRAICAFCGPKNHRMASRVISAGVPWPPSCSRYVTS